MTALESIGGADAVAEDTLREVVNIGSGNALSSRLSPSRSSPGCACSSTTGRRPETRS